MNGGLPESSAFGKDVHADREAARCFNPQYLRSYNAWDSVGARLFQFVFNLVFASWTASSGYTTEQLIQNALSAYYMLLAAGWYAYSNHGNNWYMHFLPRRTFKNLVSLG